MAKYELRIAHLYGDLMNTYGDYGNILALKYYGKQMGVKIDSDVVSIDTGFKADDYDLAVFGGGQDFEQSIVSKDLQTKKTELTKFIEEGKPMVAICGGFQMLGKYYIDAQGNKMPGIGALDHYTEQQHDNRFIGNISIKNDENGDTYKGFENHQGVTYLGKGEKPLGTIIKGYGNNGKDHAEGAIYKNVYCTYFHGPILARNGQLAKRMILTALHNKYPDQDFSEQASIKVPEAY
ncbi:type 1 glutamine amidotransferase [Lactobacillaceae bacterium Melli_B3]